MQVKAITDTAEQRLRDLPEETLREILQQDHRMTPEEIEEYLAHRTQAHTFTVELDEPTREWLIWRQRQQEELDPRLPRSLDPGAYIAAGLRLSRERQLEEMRSGELREVFQRLQAERAELLRWADSEVLRRKISGWSQAFTLTDLVCLGLQALRDAESKEEDEARKLGNLLGASPAEAQRRAVVFLLAMHVRMEELT